MFTVKVFYSSGQINLLEAETVNISNGSRRVSLGGQTLLDLGLDGTETIYIENEAGKTVHVVRPGEHPPA